MDARSEKNLRDVHPDMAKVVCRAMEISEIPFIVTEGLRTWKRQAELVKAGASRTMDSLHLTGDAVDVAALVGGKVRWSWPLYEKIAKVMKAAGKELGFAITWGGDWKKFPDGCHFEINPKRKRP